MKSTSDKTKGKAKQVIGNLTDNKELKARGKVQEAKGDMEAGMKHMGDKIARKLDR